MIDQPLKDWTRKRNLHSSGGWSNSNENVEVTNGGDLWFRDYEPAREGPAINSGIIIVVIVETIRPSRGATAGFVVSSLTKGESFQTRASRRKATRATLTRGTNRKLRCCTIQRTRTILPPCANHRSRLRETKDPKLSRRRWIR